MPVLDTAYGARRRIGTPESAKVYSSPYRTLHSGRVGRSQHTVFQYRTVYSELVGDSNIRYFSTGHCIAGA
eukprot:2593560-Rhodomonas_salina.3